MFALSAFVWTDIPDLRALGGPLLPFVFASGLLWELREIPSDRREIEHYGSMGSNVFENITIYVRPRGFWRRAWDRLKSVVAR